MSNRYMGIALLLIRLYPRAWRERYQEEMEEVLKQHSVRFVTLFDIMIGALDVHMHADLQPERIYSMAHKLRVSAIAVFCAFLLFALAYIALQQIVDPRALFNAVASSHPDLQVSFSTIVVSAEIAFLAVVVGGLVILCVALAKAIQAGRRDVLARFGSAILLVILFVVASLIFQGFLNGNAGFSGIYILIFLAVLIAATVLIVQGVLRTEFSVKLLRFMIIPMAITGLAMGISCIAALTWLLRLWADAPQFATSQSMGPGLAGGLGGSTGFAINVVVMALTTVLAIAALVRGLRTNRATLA